MKCNWLQIFSLCAAILFHFTVGNPNGNRTNEQQHSQPDDTSNNGANNDIRSRPNRHICTIFTEGYDCQIQNVHLKTGQPSVFGLERNPQQKLTFRDSTLECLPKSLIDAFPNVTLLNLNSLKIRSIEPNAFEHAAILTTVFIEDNRLINIERNAFGKARTLEMLVLSNNEINFIDRNAFNWNTLLQHLYLDRNQLKELPLVTFNGYLQYLNASHNNLELIDDNHFIDLKHLKTLDISFNRLKRLNLQHLYGTIELIDVSCNELTSFIMPMNVQLLKARNNSLTEFAVNQQCTLTYLSLANNKLETQPKLESCRVLEVLDLSYNLLEAFALKPSMTSLKELRLQNNLLFEIQLPIKKPQAPLSLSLLDLSYNKLSYGPSLSVFSKLEQVSLNDNFLISLRSYVDKSLINFKGYRMANNEWDCNAVEKFEHSTIDKNATLCAQNFKTVNGICCVQYKKPYNDKLNQIIREADFHERVNQKKCPKPFITNNNSMTDLEKIREAMSNAKYENAIKLKEIENATINANNLNKQLDVLQVYRERLNYSKRNVSNEIERKRHLHRVPKEGLISNQEMLRQVIQFVQEKDAFNRDLLNRREENTNNSNRLFDSKQQEIDKLNQAISILKTKIADLKVEEKAKKKEKDNLEKSVNKNAASIHGGSGRIAQY